MELQNLFDSSLSNLSSATLLDPTLVNLSSATPLDPLCTLRELRQ